MTTSFEHLFRGLLVIPISSMVKCLLICSFLNGVVFLLSFLYSEEVLDQIQDLQIFSVCGLSFHFISGFYEVQMF